LPSSRSLPHRDAVEHVYLLVTIADEAIEVGNEHLPGQVRRVGSIVEGNRHEQQHPCHSCRYGDLGHGHAASTATASSHAVDLSRMTGGIRASGAQRGMLQSRCQFA
jgi:hypothetical protein